MSGESNAHMPGAICESSVGGKVKSKLSDSRCNGLKASVSKIVARGVEKGVCLCVENTAAVVVDYSGQKRISLF